MAMADTADCPQWSMCPACCGTGYVECARAYRDPAGTITTMIAETRCLHCRERPGYQRGTGPPA